MRRLAVTETCNLNLHHCTVGHCICIYSRLDSLRRSLMLIFVWLWLTQVRYVIVSDTRRSQPYQGQVPDI